MTDNSELKRLAEAASEGVWGQDGFDVLADGSTSRRIARCNWLGDAKFIAAANPAAVLALIAENDSTRKHWQNESNNVQALMAEVLRLKAENDRLETERAELWRGKRDVEATRDTKSAVITELRAEVAGLRTGYEAYERVNAELKAEVEGLRKALADILDLYDTDEGCRSLPQYIVGRAAMGQGEQS